MGEYHGHLTHKDGSHTPLTKEDADALWRSFEEEDQKRAAEMPHAWDATRLIIRAKERLRKLGWHQGGGFSVKKGDECAVIELGSTGIWSGWLDEGRKFVHFAGGCSSPEKVWLKPLGDLTTDERARMVECDKDAADWNEQECKRFAAMAEFEVTRQEGE